MFMKPFFHSLGVIGFLNILFATFVITDSITVSVIIALMGTFLVFHSAMSLLVIGFHEANEDQKKKK